MLNKEGKLINPECRIEVTNRCNASCSVCARAEMTRKKGIMDTGFFRDLALQAKKLGAETISPFGFGEPLLDKELPLKVAFCSNHNLKSFITTNGSLESVMELFWAGISHIRFSIHGINKNDYEDVHQGLPWEVVMRNLVNALKERNLFCPDTIISISIIPMHGETVEQIVEFWEKYEGLELEIWKPHNWSTTKKYREITGGHVVRCFRPESGPLQIQWDGTVIPCCFLTNSEMVLGNAHTQSLEKILKGRKFQELRVRHMTGDLSGLPCNECDQRVVLDESPLLYSSIDKDRKINTTSSIKFQLHGGKENGTDV